MLDLTLSNFTCTCHHFWLCYRAVACKNMRITIFLRWSLMSEWKLWVLAQSLMIAVSFHLSAFMTPQRFSLGCCLLNWDWLKQYESYIQHCTTEGEICSFCCLSFSFAFIFWQALGACYRFPKCISLHFCNLRWPLRYFAPRLYIHTHKKEFYAINIEPGCGFLYRMVWKPIKNT